MLPNTVFFSVIRMIGFSLVELNVLLLGIAGVGSLSQNKIPVDTPSSPLSSRVCQW